MPELSLHKISRLVHGQLVNNREDFKVVDFHFDSRLIEDKPTLFFALKSESGDGHHYISKLNGSRVAAVVDRTFDRGSLSLPMVVVEDPLKAAQLLAAEVRQQMDQVNYVGITGSAGKTTTKEFLYQIVNRKFPAFRSMKNWNNWIGLPFSLLKMRGDERIAIFELAMSYPGIGEIDLLAKILRPDIAVLLNVYPVHLEFLHNVSNVALAKSEILKYLQADDVGFVNGDIPEIRDQVGSKRQNIYYFGRQNAGNQIQWAGVEKERNGRKMVIDFMGSRTLFTTHLINHIHLENLFVAIMVALQMGLTQAEIQQGINDIEPLEDRGKVEDHGEFVIINETYNSNPEALKKTLLWVDEEYTGTKIAVIGDMLELGEAEDDYHFQAGQFFAGLTFQYLLTVGRRARKVAAGARTAGFAGSNIFEFQQSREAGEFLRQLVHPNSAVLFKASRGIRLEQAVKEFLGDG